jgi:hypothetical protein
MKRRTYKPLVLDDDGPQAQSQPEALSAHFVDAEPDRDLDMALFEPTPKTETQHPDPADLYTSEEAAQPLARRQPPERHAPTAVRGLPPLSEAKGSQLAYIAAGATTAIWAVIPLGFFAGYAKGVEPLTYAPFALTLLGAWAVGSIGILWVAARMLGQSLRLSAEVRYARATAEDLLTPAAIAAAGAGSVIEVVRREIDAAVAAAGQARHELTTLREVLASETAKLAEAAASSARTVTEITGAMGHERDALGSLSTALGVQVAEVEDAIGRQARMVSEASDLAETQIREAEATLAARAADLAAAAGDATDAARVAGEDLSRQAARLESAGAGVTDQIRVVEEGLAEQRAALVSVAVSLRAEQEDFAAQVESQQAQLSEVLAQARAASRDVESATQVTSDALRDLMADTADQYRQMAEATLEERDLLGAQSLQSIGAMSEAARQQRELISADAEAAIQALADAAERAQAATDAQTESARQRIDLLSETAFAVGQKADALFDARLNDARTLIEQSAELIEEAGRRTNEKLAESLSAAQGTLSQIEGLLKEVDARTAQMPAEAKARGDEVKAVVEQGVEDLLVAARRAADETQAIDAAFQERVRRNYEMLSEAVRMMGVVGGSGVPPRTQRSPVRATPPAPSPAASAAPASPTAQELGLRPRLKFAPPAETPPESAAELASGNTLFDPSPAEAGPEPAEAPAISLQQTKAMNRPGQPLPNAPKGDWTWSDILSDLDDPAPAEGQGAREAEVSAASQVVLTEIHAMGIDPAALLPPARTNEIAGALRAGDTYGARRLVRQLAPAAMRRLARRVLTDSALRTQVSQFAEDFEGKLDHAASADFSGAALAQLIATDEGRCFLLFDAASGDGA